MFWFNQGTLVSLGTQMTSSTYGNGPGNTLTSSFTTLTNATHDSGVVTIYSVPLSPEVVFKLKQEKVKKLRRRDEREKWRR